MNRENSKWTQAENELLLQQFDSGATDSQIAGRLGRTTSAIQQQRVKLNRKLPRGKQKQSAKYTRYLKPSAEVSLFWGLIKWTKP